MVQKDASVGSALFKPDNYHLQKPDNQNDSIVQQNNKSIKPFGQDGMSFLDFLDVINPLQHIPLISTLYRSVTGDEIDPASKLMGGSLYWGPIGAVTSLVDVMIEFSTGKDIGEHMLDITKGDHADVKTAAHASGPEVGEGSILPDSLSWVLSTETTDARHLNYGIVKSSIGNNFHAEQQANYNSLQQVLLDKLQTRVNIKDGANPQSRGGLHIEKIAAAYEKTSHL